MNSYAQCRPAAAAMVVYLEKGITMRQLRLGTYRPPPGDVLDMQTIPDMQSIVFFNVFVENQKGPGLLICSTLTEQKIGGRNQKYFDL